MSEFVTLKANDGNELSAYVARPEGTPKGAVVVVQEIFGVNSHIRSVADGYAKEGYVAIRRRRCWMWRPGTSLSRTKITRALRWWASATADSWHGWRRRAGKS